MYEQDRAHIAVLEVDRERAVGAPMTVLERPYHLSYPFVFAWQGCHYLVPETGANGTVELYRCLSFPDKWELQTVLLEAENPRDATLVEAHGKWWMFVNLASTQVWLSSLYCRSPVIIANLPPPPHRCSQ